uniref:NACHT LRR and PYD domain-containing protein n=1 Tax=Kryptolebias marmoratus TaxID=37003 RepID=A0A3Q3EV82_KRYMA
MCHIPVFCWITATVLEDVLKTREDGELPNTLTEMYIHFLVVQTKVKKVKYDGGAQTDQHWSPESRKMIESLGKLAFEQLQKGNLIFYESDLTECGIDIRAASVYSGVFTQIFKEERGLYQDKVFCFVHLSVQEFMAALHVHLTFINSGVNLMEEKQQTISVWSKSFKNTNINDLHQIAVDKALQSPNGHLDLFLRFLLGLSLQTNQTLLRGLLTQTGSSSQTNQETVQYIKNLISENLSAEKSINLFHCLNELKDGSLVEEIQQSLSSGNLSTDKLSPAHWSALAFILLLSGKILDQFDPKKYSINKEAVLRLLPVVKASKNAQLSDCGLSKTHCELLASALKSNPSHLTELDLSSNNLQDSGVKILSAGLEIRTCTNMVLILHPITYCEISCSSLGSALKSNPCHMRHLDLRDNNLQDCGVKHLCSFLESPQCRLKTLRSYMFITCLCTCVLQGRISCSSLVLALNSNPSHLRHLDLSDNNLQDSGVKQLVCICLWGCSLSEISCSSLVSALKSNPSHLRELDLRDNKLQDSGVNQLCGFLESPQCRLETLRLWRCSLSKISCSSLGSALKSNPSHLKELNLGSNNLQDPDVQQLLDLVKSPVNRLRTLRSVEGWSRSCCFQKNLTKANSSQKPQFLKEVKCSESLKILFCFLSLHFFSLFRLWRCSLSKISCSSLGSALKSNPSHLKELNLGSNNLQDPDVQQLLDLVKSPVNRLRTLRSVEGWSRSLKACRNFNLADSPSCPASLILDPRSQLPNRVQVQDIRLPGHGSSCSPAKSRPTASLISTTLLDSPSSSSTPPPGPGPGG